MNLIKHFRYPIIIIVLIFLYSCENKQGGTSETGRQDSVIIKYTALQDSVSSNWDKMIADDDYKHVLMNRLLLEVSYTNNYDKDQFNDLKEEIELLKKMRYNQNTMSNSSLIDMYDSATWSVADHIIAFARSHPRYPDFPLMGELIDDINQKNNMIIIHRIHYDNWVKKLNAFTNKNSKEIKEELPEFEAKEMPLFELSS